MWVTTKKEIYYSLYNLSNFAPVRGNDATSDQQYNGDYCSEWMSFKAEL